MKIIKNFLFLSVILIQISCSTLLAEQKYHSDARIRESDRAYLVLEELFTSSGEIMPGQDYLLTWADAIEIFDYWKERNPSPTEYQIILTRQLEQYFDQISQKGQIEIQAGIDYLHHTVPDCTSSNEFYQLFRDHDFNIKYEQRERFLDASLRLPLHKHVFLSTRTSLRNDWKYFNERQNDFPRNLKEFNININERSILQFHLANFKVIFGRDRISMGIGQMGKLLIGSNVPETNHLQFQYRYKDKLVFNHIVATMKNAVIEEERPKILYAHRLTYRFLNRFAVSLSEMQMTNQSFNAAYMNPLIVFHNLYDYPEQRNILTAVDLEAVPMAGLRTYASFAVDEIDNSALEENGDMGREAWGLLIGVNWVRPLNINHSTVTMEYIKLTEWMYNHGFPWEDYYSLNYVFEERQGLTDPSEFHRFIGHHLGANAEAMLAKIKWQQLEFHCRWLKQGEIPIFSRAFSKPVRSLKQNRLTLGLHYHDWLWNDRVEIKTSVFHTAVDHFHQYQDLSVSYTEFWVSLKFRILNYRWDMSGLW